MEERGEGESGVRLSASGGFGETCFVYSGLFFLAVLWLPLDIFR